jgi:hypothetical protein
MVGLATPLTLPLYGESYRALPLQVPVEVLHGAPLGECLPAPLL